MKTIRTSVFETNSSSTHSVTLMTDDELRDFEMNGGLFDFDHHKPISWADYYERFKADCKRCHVDDSEMPTLEQFKDAAIRFNQHCDYEPFDNSEAANRAIWSTCRNTVFLYDGVADIVIQDRKLDGKTYHAVSAYVSE